MIKNKCGCSPDRWCKTCVDNLMYIISNLNGRIENLETITIGLSSDIEKLNKRLGSMSDNIDQNPGNIFVGGSCCDD